MRLQFKADDLAHPGPVPVPDARITEGLQQGEVFLELIQLHLEELGGAFGVGTVGEDLGEFVHCAPHCANIVINFFSIQLKEWTYMCTHEYCNNYNVVYLL